MGDVKGGGRELEIRPEWKGCNDDSHEGEPQQHSCEDCDCCDASGQKISHGIDQNEESITPTFPPPSRGRELFPTLPLPRWEGIGEGVS
jgi:hypothetical protein